MTGIILFAGMMGFIIVGIPVAYAISSSAILYLSITHLKDLTIVAQQMFAGMNSFLMLAVPLFTLAGFLMEQGGISKRLIDWARYLFGNIPGSMGTVTLVCCGIFAALTGSGPATVAGIGSIMVPALINAGYRQQDAAGVIAGGGALGPIIPPSIPMIIYGSAMSVSVPMLFIAGIAPGVLLMLLLIVINIIYTLKNGIKTVHQEFSFAELLKKTWSALGALCLPVIVLGGIYGGVFTPTEASAIAVVYCLILGVAYRAFTLETIIIACKKTVLTASMIMVIVGTAAIFTWLLSVTRIPTMVVSAVTPYITSKTAYMLVLIAVLFVAGALMDAGPSILILGPVLSPIGVALGVDPLFLGVVFCICLVVGYITPPYGLNLFTAASTANVPYASVVKGTLPYMIVAMIFIVVIALCPDFILWLPRTAGYIG